MDRLCGLLWARSLNVEHLSLELASVPWLRVLFEDAVWCVCAALIPHLAVQMFEEAVLLLYSCYQSAFVETYQSSQPGPINDQIRHSQGQEDGTYLDSLGLHGRKRHQVLLPSSPHSEIRSGRIPSSSVGLSSVLLCMFILSLRCYGRERIRVWRVWRHG